MTTRTKVATTSISNGTVTFTCYSDPAAGPQTVTSTLPFNVQDLSTLTILDLAAFGFASVAANRYQRTDQHPDVPTVCTALFTEMKAGDWKPGSKRDTGPAEPSDLVKAIAEATKTPVHIVAHEFDTKMELRNDGSLYTNSAGRTRRFFNKQVQAELAADPAIAPILARLEQERASAALAASAANRSPSKLTTLFPPSPPPDPP